MADSLDAADPARHASVTAAAGTGKTWLLVTRMVRLLLAGAPPDGILAITFTRKAAGEMLERLSARLWDYASCDDAALDDGLRALGVEPDAQTRETARGLYERLLMSPRPPRLTTFHAFCQEVLQRFPLEADVPPGFELVDTAGLLEREAWDALYQEATVDPDGALGQALETLFRRCGGPHNAHAALTDFLQRRSDWWAFAESGGTDPVAHAARVTAALLQTEPGNGAPADLLDGPVRGQLQAFAELLARHPTRTNEDHAARIAAVLENRASDPLAELTPVFFKANGEPRARGTSKAQRKALGAADEDRFLALDTALTERIDRARDAVARQRTLELSQAWHLAGNRLVAHFQRIKRERRWLDFTDLEWKAYQLLTRGDNAHWVQFKLDQRIDHLLIDEFQDTNPTQWRLLLPLLEELAAAEPERARSVFLVGDDKQSIYRFRRAEPQLLENAAQWLDQRLGAIRRSLDRSRRSAPAIIDCVNAVFGDTELGARFRAFHTHGTHRTDLWGRVEVLTLATDARPPAPQGPQGLRNPLHRPRAHVEDLRHYEEGRLIAAHIRALMAEATPVHDGERARPLGYNDIFILLRKRTHAGPLERALRDAGIPYLGAGRGTLLESLEVSDMEALLNTLIAPYDNLALAQVLRSPIFSVGDEDLERLAGAGDPALPWMDRLAACTAQLDPQHPLHRAHRLLSAWQALAGRLPVHDLLDRIFSQGDLPTRYEAAFPEPLRPRLHANLARFIELALEVDSGRYPSLARFLEHLQRLKRHALEAPDEPPALTADDRVRVLTIHAAKGLEAPVVYLADAAAANTAPGAYRALVDWPAGAPRPTHFLLTGKREDQDSVSQGLIAGEAQADAREEANLLYVALTRAQQYLVISASEPTRGQDLGWYGAIRDAVASLATERDGRLMIESGRPPASAAAAPPPDRVSERPDPRLSGPVPRPASTIVVAPSRTVEHAGDGALPEEDGRPRGLAIHRMLELATGDGAVDGAAIRRHVAGELALDPQDPRLTEWWSEARALLTDPGLAPLFDPRCYNWARNEVAIHYRDGRGLVYGVIDRLVAHDGELVLVDYKTHRDARPDNLNTMAAPFREQLRLYVGGLNRMWPELTVRPHVLFTVCRGLHELHLEESRPDPMSQD